MPTPETDAPNSSTSADVTQHGVACPRPLTPPPERDDQAALGALQSGRRQQEDCQVANMTGAVDDNTAAGMSMMQEDSIYIGTNIASTIEPQRETAELVVEKDKMDVMREQPRPSTGTEDTAPKQPDPIPSAHTHDKHMSDTCTDLAIDPGMPRLDPSFPGQTLPSPPPSQFGHNSDRDDASPIPTSSTSKSGPDSSISSVDQELDHTLSTAPWDFSQRRLTPHHPSSLFRPFSKYTGTQHSDRQVYNVEVTILTVDISECSMTGYLQICGLTPDHPTLTTFFTGEIIGGPPSTSRHTFRTSDPSWGASDKTDITHWVKFPEWRPLATHAKRNINFTYPLDGGEWWQQDIVFMRWKEHFLVPDYKLKSIQGASFEGFYYICLNQVEGKISGMYFHSKSEK